MRTLMVGIGAFELGNMASTLLILRATELLTPGHGKTAAVQLALVLYTAYNIAATLISIPAGALGDRHGSPRILLAGAAAFLASYIVLARTGPSVPLLAIGFVLAGIAIGCGETAETTAIALLAPDDARGSAFGLLAATQSVGNLIASVTAGILWSAISPAAAFLFAAGAMLLALAAFAPGALAHHSPSENTGP
jgi:MFS family permease